jgi:pimeloyl-ACP methyl ester carboxylesterase
MNKSVVVTAVLAAALIYSMPVNAGRHSENVSYPASDGFAINATYIRGEAGAPLVLLLHQLGSDRLEYGALAGELNGRGMHILMPDARGHGESVKRDGVETYWDGFGDDEFESMRLDIEAALGYARHELGLQGARLGIVGSSIQSSTALLYSENDDKVGALVLLSPGLAYRGIDTARPMRGYSGRPVFMAASEGDARSRDAVRELAPLAGRASECRIADGTAHGVGMFESDPRLMKDIADWLEDRLSH